MPATIIDSLLVTLGLDDGEFNKKRTEVDKGLGQTGEAGRRAGRAVGDSTKQMSLGVSQLRSEVVGLFLAFAGAKTAEQYLTGLIDKTRQIGTAAQQMGVPVNMLNAWGDAAKAAGGDAAGAVSAFQTINNMYADMVRNPGKIGQNSVLLSQLGLSGKMGDMSDPEKVLGDFADQYSLESRRARASGDPNAQHRVNATFTQRLNEFGIKDAGMVQLIMAGRDAMMKEIAADKERDKITEQNVQDAQNFNAALSHLHQTLDGLVRGPLMQAIQMLDALLSHNPLQNWSWDNIKRGFGALFVPGAPGNSSGGGAVGTPSAINGMAANPNVGGNPNVRATPGTAGQGQKFDAAVRFFSSAAGGGFTEQQARGIAGGLFAESGLNEHSRNGIGMQGIGQWDGARRAQFRKMTGHDPRDGTYEEQMAFVAWELAHTHRAAGEAIRRQGDEESASRAMLFRYEGPQGRYLASLGRYEHQGDLIGDYNRSAAFRKAHPRGHGGGDVHVTVHAPGHPHPHEVARKTAKAVKAVIKDYSTVVNANTGIL